jgi:hypothetical protein
MIVALLQAALLRSDNGDEVCACSVDFMLKNELRNYKVKHW